MIFSIANAVAVALYLVGFGETVQAMMGREDVTMVDVKNDVRIIGLIALILIFLITQVGLDWVIHTQSGLLFLLACAIISVVAGTAYPNPQESRETMKSYGLPGYNVENFKTNIGPDYSGSNGFFDVFAIFFPAATGIMAGANLSGDLKDPSHAVPFGTLLAIFMTSISYVALCWLLGSSTVRYALGPLASNSTSNLTTTITPISEMLFGTIPDLQVSFFCFLCASKFIIPRFFVVQSLFLIVELTIAIPCLIRETLLVKNMIIV